MIFTLFKQGRFLFLTSLCFILFYFLINPAYAVDAIQTYPGHQELSDAHKQNIANALENYRNADNIWDVLREEFSLSHYENTPAVQAKIQWYLNNQDFLLRSANRSAPYLYYILQEVKKRHLPVELVLLPIIESGYNPFSLSNVGASGIWQLMPGTASGWGVKQTGWYDGRRDVIVSTRAALNYLAYLQSFFDGNWLLAIAAYNTGEGNVLNAIRKNVRDGQNTDFWALPLSQQTRDYVPSLLALATIISHPDQYPIYFPPVRNAPYLAQIDMETPINLKIAAKLAGISHNRIMALNPGFNHASTGSKMPYKLVLPIESVGQFNDNLSRAPIEREVNWTHYRVKLGDTLASIAKKNQTSVSALNELNHIPSSQSIRRGTNLLIPHQGKMKPVDDDTNDGNTSQVALKGKIKTIATKTKKNIQAIFTKELASKIRQTETQTNSAYTLQAGDTVYMTRNRDTLFSIAKRFHLDSKTLMSANHLKKLHIKTGMQLIIPTHTLAQAKPIVTIPKKSTKKIAMQNGDTLYMVRRGDTLAKIAKRYKTTPSAIKVANLMSNNDVTTGDRLLIPATLPG